LHIPDGVIGPGVSAAAGDAGRIVADGPTRELLEDRELLAEHRLGLPAGLRIDDLETP
jgi:hypothetical protein